MWADSLRHEHVGSHNPAFYPPDVAADMPGSYILKTDVSAFACRLRQSAGSLGPSLRSLTDVRGVTLKVTLAHLPGTVGDAHLPSDSATSISAYDVRVVFVDLFL